MLVMGKIIQLRMMRGIIVAKYQAIKTILIVITIHQTNDTILNFNQFSEIKS